MDIVWDGPGVWTTNWSELGALFLNLCLVCVSGDNVTIFIDVLDAQIAPDPPVSGRSLPNSSPICALFDNFLGLNCTLGWALQPDSSNVHCLHWQKQDINCLLNSQNILSLINGAKQHINLCYDTNPDAISQPCLAVARESGLAHQGEFFHASEEVLAGPRDCETTSQNTHSSQAASDVTSDGKSHLFILVSSCQQIKVQLLQRRKPGACEQAEMVAPAWVERPSHGFGQINLLQASNFHKGHLLP